MDEGKKRIKSMKGIMISLFLCCWLLPMALMIGVGGYYIFSNHFYEKAQNIEKELSFNSQICVERLNQTIRLSRAATLDKVIETAWNDFRKGDSNYPRFYLNTSSYLSAQYRQRQELMNVIFWSSEKPSERYCSIYNTSCGGSYQQIVDYWKQDHEAVYEYAQGLDTAVGFLCLDGRLYLVRNLLSSSYTNIGTLVMRLNPDYYFGPIKQYPSNTGAIIWLDNQELLLKGEEGGLQSMKDDILKTAVPAEQAGFNEGSYVRKKGVVYINQKIKEEDYTFSSLIKIDVTGAEAPLFGYKYVFAGMALFLLPLLFVLLRVFRRHITDPVKALMDGAFRIREGDIGHQIDYEPENKEFQYLTDAFNSMSGRIKYQFEHIYQEELALRDARIMALQSNINPHFMNNTLEIINWEARMGDNAKVSKMIEALATLMDAAMDRKRKAEVTLSEELMYVDAYLYIISERFGKRLTVEKEISPNTLRLKLPRLILQPVIENAIEHGVQAGGYGTVRLKTRKDEEYLYVVVENDGTLTAEDEDRIKRLLSPNYDTSRESSGNLGIANVNQRLKILYGNQSGLAIEKDGENIVAAKLVIKQ